MKYLSDTLQEYRALEHFIASGACGELLHRERNALFHVPENQARFAPIAKEILKHLSIDELHAPKLPETLPTRFDNPFGYNITQSLVKKLKKTCQTIGIALEDFPPFACIPTGVVNAYAANVPGSGSKFLLFDSQVFFFCNLWSKALATAQPILGVGEHVSTSTDINLVRRHLESNSTPVLRLRELLHASLNSSPSNAPPYLPDKNYVPLISLLRDSMELFIVAHEFGHVYAGHLGPLLAALPRSASDLLEAANDAQRMEYEADTIALYLTMHCLATEGFDPALSSIGPYLFFSGLDLLARQSDREHGAQGNDGPIEHPSNVDRQFMLNEVALTLIESEQMEAAISLQTSFTAIVAELELRINHDA